MERSGLVLYHGLTDGTVLARYGQIAEDCGYESLWVTERYFHEETFSLLGYLAAVTTRLRLGVGVVNPYSRHPALTAMAAATLDRLSGGRLMLGLGRSERDVVEERLGIPYGDPATTLEAAVRIIRSLLAGERLAERSTPFQVHGKLTLQPVQRPVPIYLAAIGRRALRLAGAIADGVVLNAYVPTGYVPWAIGELHAGARAAGRDPHAIDVACMLVVRAGPDATALRPSLRERVVRLLCERYVGEILLDTGGFDRGALAPLRAAVAAGHTADAAALVSDAMIDAFYLIGPAARLRERVAAYRAAGVTAPLLLPRLEDFESVARSLAPT
jgi:5,10-methylenetetrahydromethanopterin reductase